MKIIRILCLWLFVCNNSYCQNNYESDSKFCIKVAPLSLLDIYSGMSPRLGLEYKLKNNFALYNEIGTYIPNVNGMSNNRGFLTKMEFKVYLNKVKYTSGGYVSAEIFYKKQSYGTYDTIQIISDKYLKNYNVKKSVTCFTIKTGVLHVFESGFLLDLFIGFGVRNRNISSNLTEDENRNIQQDGESSINIYKNKAGIFNVLNLDMGVKIGYRIR